MTLTSRSNGTPMPFEQLELFGKPSRLLIREALPIYRELEGRHLPGKSYKYDEKRIEEHLGNIWLDELTKYNVRDYRKARKLDNPDLKESSINREHTRITRIINAFKEWKRENNGRIGAYDLSELKLPEDNPGELWPKYPEEEFRRNRVVTPEEFQKFCYYAHPEVRKICVIAVLTLLRRKDIELLQDSALNQALNTISGIQSKTKKPYNIPLALTVRVMFQNKEHRYLVDFTNFRRRFTRAKVDSGVFFQLRDLRRSGATELLLNGVDIRTIQQLLGHADISMTEAYLRPPPVVGREAVKKIEKSFIIAAPKVDFEYNLN